MNSARGVILLAMFALAWAPAVSELQPLAADANAGIAINDIGALAYPAEMYYSGVRSGEVRVVISVDEQGRLVDSLVTGYTDRGFVDAAEAAVKKWSYEPARTNGRPQSARADVLFIYKDEGVIVQRLPGATERLFVSEFMESRYVYEPYRLRDLDRIPTPIHVVSPSVPRFSGTDHTVTVGFYIDEAGRVRIPAVERESADDLLAAAAVLAVEQWRFEQPLRKGRPVLCYAQQEFTFKARE